MKKDITLEEVFAEPLFKEKFLEEIRSIEQDRAAILRAQPGARFKKSAYSSLRDKNALNADYCCNELLQIISKKSTLPSAERQWIEALMEWVVGKTLEVLLKKPAAPAKKRKPIPKKNEASIK